MSSIQYDPTSTRLTPSQGVRRVEILGNWTKAALAGSALLWLIEAAAAFWLLALFDQSAEFTDFFFGWFENGSGLLGLSWLVTGSLFVWWHWSARKTVRTLGRRNLKRSDSATLGWWLVPFANLVIPFQVMAETHKASTVQGSRWDTAETDPQVHGWTATFLIGFLGVQGGAEVLGSASDDTFFFIHASGAATISLAGYLAFRLIDDITKGQKKLLKNYLPQQTAPTQAIPGDDPRKDGFGEQPSQSETSAELAEQEGRISTLESLVADGVLARQEAGPRALAILAELNAKAPATTIDMSRLADLNSRLLALCEDSRPVPSNPSNVPPGDDAGKSL